MTVSRRERTLMGSVPMFPLGGGSTLDAEACAWENATMARPRKYYEKIECLRDIYLEDSFVLKLTEGLDSIEFELEAVLTKEHPRYRPPKQNERHCYKKLTLRLGNCSNVRWVRKSLTSSTGTDGETDYDNIDHFTAMKNKLHLSGDWGEVRLVCSEVSTHSVSRSL